jgi:hypothetical protein
MAVWNKQTNVQDEQMHMHVRTHQCRRYRKFDHLDSYHIVATLCGYHQ